MAAQPDYRGDRMPDRLGPSGGLDVEVDRREPAPAVTVKVRGEIDVATAPALQQRLETLLDGGVEDLVLDLQDVPFCDVSGLNMLLRVQTQLWARGGRLRVRRPCPTLRRMVAVLGLVDCLPLMATDGPDRADGADEDGAGAA